MSLATGAAMAVRAESACILPSFLLGRGDPGARIEIRISRALQVAERASTRCFSRD